MRIPVIGRRYAPATLVLLAAAFLAPPPTDYVFGRVYVDVEYGGNGRPGWVRSGDVDNDGDRDIVAGGGQAIFAYENNGAGSNWTRSVNLDATEQIGGNGAILIDVDEDGDLDLISAKFYDDIGWWENPCGAACDLETLPPWQFHYIGAVGQNGSAGPHYYLHDIEPVDFGGSDMDFVAPAISSSCAQVQISWFEPTSDVFAPWSNYVIEDGRSASSDGPCNHAGIDVADVDGDGLSDLAFSNGWYERPANARSTWPADAWHPITSYDGISNTLVRDLNNDGRKDIVVAAGHVDGMADIRWYENPGSVGVSWPEQVVGTLRSPECLQVEDMNRDGHLDIVSCDLDWAHWDEEVHNVYVFENEGDGQAWAVSNIATDSYPGHLLQLVDVNVDQKVDIIGESTGYSVVVYFENMTADSELPLELVSFEARLDGAEVVLDWTTSEEVDVAGFEVQREQGDAFRTIAFVEAKGTTADDVAAYRFVDETHGQGRIRYRLRIIDLDGSFEYSESVEITNRGKNWIEVSGPYPNPATSRATLEFSVQREQRVVVEIFDLQGRRVLAPFDGLVPANAIEQVTVDLTSLPAGTYVVRFHAPTMHASRMLTVVR